VAFRVMAVLTSLWVLAVVFFGLTEVVLMWLPAGVLRSTGLPIDDLAAHRTHYLSAGIAAWALLLGVVVQLWRPERRVAPMLHGLAIAVAAAVVYALSGGPGEWLAEDLTLAVPLLVLGLLHPRARQLRRLPGCDRPMAVLAAAGAVPWLFFAVTHAQRQWRNVAGDAHAEVEHWATAALMALTVVACALIGATRHAGWRLTAWIAAVASVCYGLHSLIYPEPASALAAPWAAAAVLWGAGYAALIVRRGRLVRRLARLE
jgi:hypothetical protein